MIKRLISLNLFKALGIVGMSVALTFAQTTIASAEVAPKMKTGQRTTQPIGHFVFCKKYPKECSIRTNSTKPTKLTKRKWNEIVRINAYANNKVKPVSDLDLHGKEEVWSYPGNAGDCEDYVLLKRRMLMQKGWPASSLLVTVVRQKNGDGHAVLTVRTDRGDYILDNMVERINLWSKTQYTFLKRQSAANTGHWEDIVDTRRLVSSIN